MLKEGNAIMTNSTVVYPVVLKPDGDYIFVRVPNLEGGYTQGNNEIDAVKMAQDLIGNLLEDKSEYPKPSDSQDIKLADDEKLVFVSVDLESFRKKYSRTVRRNITVPEYLSDMANEKGLNVSQVATKALKIELGI